MNTRIVEIGKLSHDDLGCIESHFFGQIDIDAFIGSKGTLSKYSGSMFLNPSYRDEKYYSDYKQGRIFVLKNSPIESALIYKQLDSGDFRWVLNERTPPILLLKTSWNILDDIFQHPLQMTPFMQKMS